MLDPTGVSSFNWPLRIPAYRLDHEDFFMGRSSIDHVAVLNNILRAQRNEVRSMTDAFMILAVGFFAATVILGLAYLSFYLIRE